MVELSERRPGSRQATKMHEIEPCAVPKGIQVGPCPRADASEAGFGSDFPGGDGNQAVEAKNRVIKIARPRSIFESPFRILFPKKEVANQGCGIPEETGRQTRDLQHFQAQTHSLATDRGGDPLLRPGPR